MDTHYHLFQGVLGNQHRFYLQGQPSLHREKSLSQPKLKRQKKNQITKKSKTMQRDPKEKRPASPPQHTQTLDAVKTEHPGTLSQKIWILGRIHCFKTRSKHLK